MTEKRFFVSQSGLTWQGLLQAFRARTGGGCGLFRAATISSVPFIGAEKSVGYGGSPLVQTLRLASGSAPPSGKVRRQGGGWREESISGCELARDHTPRLPGLEQFGTG